MGHPVIGIEGFSGSGKTTLIEKLIPVFKEQGLKVAVIKHDAHDFDMDREGKDTYRFSAAGADHVMISSKSGSAVIRNEARSLERMLDDTDASLVIVEGYKDAAIPKLLVVSKRTGHEYPGRIEEYKAVITDEPLRFEDTGTCPVFDIDDVPAIAGWITENKDSMDSEKGFTHFDDEGNARMVDVSDKDVTVRTARAAARVLVNEETFRLIKDGGIKKGDVLSVAQTAGIMGAKRTPDLIPMCHPIIIDGINVRLKLNEKDRCVDIESEVKCTGRTGVEMEAISACSVAAMTVYDMCKSVQRDIVITEIKLMSKSGGVHGDYERGSGKTGSWIG